MPAPSPVKAPKDTPRPRKVKSRRATTPLSELYKQVKRVQKIQLARSWFDHKSKLGDNEALDDLILMRCVRWKSTFKWRNFPDRHDGAMFIKPVVRETNYVTPRDGYPMDLETWEDHVSVEMEREAGERQVKLEELMKEREVLPDGGAEANAEGTPKRKSRGNSPIKVEGQQPSPDNKKQKTLKTPDQPVGMSMERPQTPHVRKILKRCSSPLWKQFAYVTSWTEKTGKSQGKTAFKWECKLCLAEIKARQVILGCVCHLSLGGGGGGGGGRGNFLQSRGAEVP